MTDKEAIKYLQQLYPNGGHCWLDEQRIEAISMAIKVLQEEPEKKCMFTKDNYTDEERKVLCADCDEKCEYSKKEEPVSESIDFEQELYKAFGQIKDFTLGIAIAKRFYDMGRKHNEPVSEDLDKAVVEYMSQFLGENYYNSPWVMDSTGMTMPKELARFGAKWQKEQMMAKAIETTFNVSLPSSLYEKLWIKCCKEGDKLLVIKKDEL